MEIFLLYPFLIFISAGYIIGSIPFGLILTKVFTQTDIRTIGSGNIGATNVLRTGNKKLAAATLLLDASKSAIPIGFMHYSFLQTPDPQMPFIVVYWVGLIMGLGAILGHCYPIWLKFKGGKGVATALGALLAAVPIAGLAACVAWLLTAKVTKISSLSALVAIAIAPIVTLFIYDLTASLICGLITLLVWWRHRENIKRLLAATEPKIGAKKKEEDENNPQS